MQIRRFIGIIALCMISMAALAQHITSQEAMERATKFLKDKNLSSHSESMAAPVRRDVKLKETEVDVQSIYAFNVDGGGYVIASADERILPVLGYSDKGSIDWESLPENMKAWLKSYDDALATLGERMDFKDGNCLTTGREYAPKTPSRAEKKAIEPLISTHWYQEAPYWDNIPAYDGADKEEAGKNCLTGCVATTMAQIMNYYQWPKEPTAGIPAYEIETEKDGVKKNWKIDGLPSVTFDWDNMLDQYVVTNPKTYRQTVIGTQAQQEAVATLMRYCAQSVGMIFSTQGSSADDSKIAQALYYYFDYAPTAYYAGRQTYDIDDWETLIYDEIAAGRPVAYGGCANLYSGHSFICDGYDEDGLFHINWGWGGWYDGYFTLSVLNPYNHGIGYCMMQGAVIGIQPSDTDNIQSAPLYNARMYDFMEIIGKDTVYFYYSFSSNVYMDAALENIYQNVVHDYAMGTIEPDGTLNPRFIGDPSDSIVYNYNWMSVIIDSTAFKKGETTILYPMVRFRHIPGSDWQMIAGPQYGLYAGYNRYSGNFFLQFTDYPSLTIRNAVFTTGSGDAVKERDLTLTLRNDSKFDFTGKIGLRAVYYGDVKPEDVTDKTPYTIGNDIWYSGAYVRSNEEADVTFTITPKQNGLITLWLYSDTYGYINYYDIVFDGSDSNGVTDVFNDMKPDIYYDLNGRNMNGIPVRRGIYIRGKEKVLIE